MPPIARFGLRELALGLVLSCSAVAAPADAQVIDGRCTVQFFATSTLHDFEGSAPCALLAIDPPDANGAYSARAEVAVAQLDTRISARNKKMREMFEAKRFARITASFDRLDPNALRRGSGVPFRISIHGVERSVAPVLSGWSEAPGKSARFRAAFALSLRDFGMEPPVAMGFIRVDESVKVEVAVELTARKGALQASPPPGAANWFIDVMSPERAAPAHPRARDWRLPSLPRARALLAVAASRR